MFSQDVIFFTADLTKTTSVVVFISHYCTIIRFSAMKSLLKVFFISNIMSENEILNLLLVVF